MNSRIVATLFVITSCAGDESVPERAEGASEYAECPTVSPGTGRVGPDLQPIIRLAEQVPDLGGLYWTPAEQRAPGTPAQNKLTVYLTEPSEARGRQVQPIISQYYGTPNLLEAELEVFPAAYSLLELADYFSVGLGVWEIPEVHQADIDEAANRISFTVETESAVLCVENALLRFGIPRNAFLVEQRPPIVPL